MIVLVAIIFPLIPSLIISLMANRLSATKTPILAIWFLNIIASPIMFIIGAYIYSFTWGSYRCGFIDSVECSQLESVLQALLFTAFMTAFIPYMCNITIGTAACIKIWNIRRRKSS